jgi:hypothetical protein
MNDTLEQSLRALYGEDAASYDTSDAVERLRFRIARPQRKRGLVWPALGLGGTALTGSIVAAVLLLSSGAPAAYAGWTSVPTAATPAAVASTSDTCAHAFTGTGATANERAFTQQPLLSEARGIYTAVIVASDGKLYSCLIGGNKHDPKSGLHLPNDPGISFHLNINDYGAVQAAPGPEQISVPYKLQSGFGEGGGTGNPGPIRHVIDLPPAQQLALRARLRGGGRGPTALGQSGSDISAVSFTFTNGKTVGSTVENGWYFAWWPWTSNPTSVIVTTNSGTITSPVTGSGGVQDVVIPQCQPGASGCVFANTTPTPPSGTTTSPVTTTASTVTTTQTTDATTTTATGTTP